MKLIPALQFSLTNHSRQSFPTLERRAVGRIPFTCCDQWRNHQAALTENALRAKMWCISVSVIKKNSEVLYYFHIWLLSSWLKQTETLWKKKNILPISCAWDTTFWSESFIIGKVQIVKGRFIFWWLMPGS